MLHSLVVVLIVFCCTVGFGLGTNGANWWALAAATLFAVAALQVSYVLGSVVTFLG